MKRTQYKGSKDEVRALNAFVKLVRASESVSTRIHRHLADAGLTVSQFGVLEALYHLGTLSQSEIAKKVLKSTGNITLVIDNLEKGDLVKRERQQEDRRYYAVRLTTKGRKLISAIFPRHAAKILDEMRTLGSAEQEALGNLCRKLGLRQQGKNSAIIKEKTKEVAMSKKLPVTMELEPGTYYWCSCGKSKKVPFCDGSHKDTTSVPVEFVMSAKKKVTLCTCQRTKKAPYCDGTHAKVD